MTTIAIPEILLFLKIGEQLEKSNTLAGDIKVLFRLRACGPDNPQSPTALYTNLGITSGGLTKILHRLKNNEHITRISNPNDGRSQLVKITPEGVAITDDIFAGIVRRDLKYLSVLDKREKNGDHTM